MSFLSIEFAIFFICFFPIYWSLGKKPRLQNILLLLASIGLLFSLHQDIKTSLLIVSSVIAFSVIIHFIAFKIFQSIQLNKRKFWLKLGIIIACCNLGFFKYFDFFRAYAKEWFNTGEMIDILMPLGISYYTFQGIAYLVSVYRRETLRLSFSHTLLHFSFFPTITSGPIIRVGEQKNIQGMQMGMAEQIQPPTTRTILYPALAVSLILLGVIKKWWLVGTLADGWVTPVFENPLQYDAIAVLLAIYGYTVQLFLDFSGYTDLVIGLAMLLGFKLPENFHMPLKAHNIRNFWERWHMTLSCWIRDYVYIPLGGSRLGFKRTQINVMIAMLLSGIWHGYGWNFLLWGFLHGLAFIGLNLSDRKFGKNAFSSQSKFKKAISILATLTFVSFSFVIFKTSSLADAGLMFKALLGGGQGWVMPDLTVIIVLAILLLSLIFYEKIVALFHAFVRFLERIPVWTWAFPITLILLFLLIVAPSGIPGFIYANF